MAVPVLCFLTVRYTSSFLRLHNHPSHPSPLALLTGGDAMAEEMSQGKAPGRQTDNTRSSRVRPRTRKAPSFSLLSCLPPCLCLSLFVFCLRPRKRCCRSSRRRTLATHPARGKDTRGEGKKEEGVGGDSGDAFLCSATDIRSDFAPHQLSGLCFLCHRSSISSSDASPCSCLPCRRGRCG